MQKSIVSVLFLIFGAAISFSGEATLKVERPWIFAVPPNAQDTAAFMTLVNPGPTPLRVTGGRTDVADRVAPMVTTKTEGRLGMKDVPFIEVPAGGRTVLVPGGDHLMLYGLKNPLKPGQSVTLILLLESGGTLEVSAVVSRREPQ